MREFGALVMELLCKDDRKELVVGLTAADLDRLRNGDEVSLAQEGGSLDWDVRIVFGEAEDAVWANMQRHLEAEHGTKVVDHVDYFADQGKAINRVEPPSATLGEEVQFVFDGA